MVNITVKNKDNKQMNIEGDIALIVSQTKDADGYSVGISLVGSASTNDLLMLDMALITDVKEKLENNILESIFDLKQGVSEEDFNKALESINDKSISDVILEYVKQKGGQS